MRIDEVPLLEEMARGCGFRKKGAIYLVADEGMRPCDKLPVPLEPCECCERPWQSRSYTWFPTKLIEAGPCTLNDWTSCSNCCIGNPQEVMGDKAGLIWVGVDHYATPEEFAAEASERGISRRIGAIPRDFVVGKTWVLLAHKLTVPKECPDCKGVGALTRDGDDYRPVEEPDSDDLVEFCERCDGAGTVKGPGIFTAFRPRQAQYVCHGNETEVELEEIMARGLTPVRVQPVDDDGNPIEVDD